MTQAGLADGPVGDHRNICSKAEDTTRSQQGLPTGAFHAVSNPHFPSTADKASLETRTWCGPQRRKWKPEMETGLSHTILFCLFSSVHFKRKKCKYPPMRCLLSTNPWVIIPNSKKKKEEKWVRGLEIFSVLWTGGRNSPEQTPSVWPVAVVPAPDTRPDHSRCSPSICTRDELSHNEKYHNQFGTLFRVTVHFAPYVSGKP